MNLLSRFQSNPVHVENKIAFITSVLSPFIWLIAPVGDVRIMSPLYIASFPLLMVDYVYKLDE